MTKKIDFLAKTLYGLEEVLSKELEQLGAQEIQIQKRAVSFSGNKELMYKSNLYLRTALKILVPIYKCKVKNEDELYSNVRNIDWSEYIEVNDTIAVDAVLYSPNFNHSHYAALKVKDAIIDQFRDKTGIRPSVNIKSPTLKNKPFIFQTITAPISP